MGFKSPVEYAEKVWFRMAGHASGSKDLLFLDIGSWISEAMLRMARTVAGTPDYRLLQRRFAFSLSDTFEACEFFEVPEAVTRDRYRLTAAAAAFVPANDNYVAWPTSGKLASVAFETQFVSGKQSFGLFSPVVDPNLAGTYAQTNAPALVVFDPANVSLPLTVYQANNSILTLNAGFQAGWYVRWSFDDAGAATLKLLDAGRRLQVTQLLGSPNNTWADMVDPVQPGALFLDANAVQDNMSMILTSAQRSVSLQTTPPLLVQSLLTTGVVTFADGTPLTRTQPGLLGQPRLCDEWYWSIEGNRLRIAPGDPDDATNPGMLFVTCVVIPSVEDFPHELNEQAILAGLEIARERLQDLRAAAELERKRSATALPRNPDRPIGT